MQLENIFETSVNLVVLKLLIDKTCTSCNSFHTLIKGKCIPDYTFKTSYKSEGKDDIFIYIISIQKIKFPKFK